MNRWTLASGVAAAAGVAAVVMAVVSQEPRPSAVDEGTVAVPWTAHLRPKTPPISPEQREVEHNADRVRGLLLPESEPTRIRIPRLGVTSPLVPLGLDPAGALEVPRDGRRAGWFTEAPTPGALGPAVIAGHVTWDGQPAIFFRLGELRPTDRVHVLRTDGATAIFAVRRVVSFAKSRFPSAAVYGSTDHAALRLITCTGRFDDAVGAYEDNAVVFAALVDVRRRG